MRYGSVHFQLLFDEYHSTNLSVFVVGISRYSTLTTGRRVLKPVVKVKVLLRLRWLSSNLAEFMVGVVAVFALESLHRTVEQHVVSDLRLAGIVSLTSFRCQLFILLRVDGSNRPHA